MVSNPRPLQHWALIMLNTCMIVIFALQVVLIIQKKEVATLMLICFAEENVNSLKCEIVKTKILIYQFKPWHNRN